MNVKNNEKFPWIQKLIESDEMLCSCLRAMTKFLDNDVIFTILKAAHNLGSFEAKKMFLGSF